MSAKAKTNPSQPIAWTLRDEMAMRLAAALVANGNWGTTAPDGTFHRYSNMREYAIGAYEFADYLLEAR